MALDEVAEAVVVSARELAAIEAGEEEASRRVVACLDRDFGAHGVLTDAWARVYIYARLADGTAIERFEAEAAQVRIYDPFTVPEPFRTRGYAAALERAAAPMRRSVPDRTTSVRRLLRADHAPPHFTLVLDETALRRGADTGDATREQLCHLRTLIAKDHIGLHVIPSPMPAHPCPRGGFRLLTFSPHHAVVHNPHAYGPGQIITDPDRVHGYTDLFSALLAAALPAHASAELLAEAIGHGADREEPRQITAGAPADPIVADPSGVAATAFSRP